MLSESQTQISSCMARGCGSPNRSWCFCQKIRAMAWQHAPRSAVLDSSEKTQHITASFCTAKLHQYLNSAAKWKACTQRSRGPPPGRASHHSPGGSWLAGTELLEEPVRLNSRISLRNLPVLNSGSTVIMARKSLEQGNISFANTGRDKEKERKGNEVTSGS